MVSQGVPSRATLMMERGMKNPKRAVGEPPVGGSQLSLMRFCRISFPGVFQEPINIWNGLDLHTTYQRANIKR